MVAGLTDGITKVNSDFVEEIKGKEGLLKLAESIKQFGEMHSNAGADYYAVTSVCNGGLYDADFGWGKPIWISIGNGSADLPMLTNVIFLMDTPSGSGVEAWVTLSEEDMAILECDPELLSSASLDPCPLLS
ncbi:hypothetical protein RJ639_025202 [Escallonia herrerae]|uniref:Uncharacterized protein n=1 Tax=Escallonia herrerae TaxID=1293975 RepID=A0AA88UW70_9ASTE|nr:hypothetical protein RJ639_025202 [Escallonia herrerae]